MSRVQLNVGMRAEDRDDIRQAAADAALPLPDYVVSCCLGRPARPRGSYEALEARVTALEQLQSPPTGQNQEPA